MQKYINDCVFIEGNNILNDYINHIKDGYTSIKTYNDKYVEIYNFLHKNQGSNLYLDCEYARLTYFGLGCVEDKMKAHNLFLKLNEKNFALAQYYLGHSFNTKNGVTKDLRLSYQYYKKAYDNGYYKAAYGLGFYHNKGLGIARKDSVISMFYLMIAICEGNLAAIEKLEYGLDYFDKEANYCQVKEYIEKQIKANNKKAHIAKAMFYIKIHGIEDNYKIIIEELLKAPEEFYGFGYFKLAFLNIPIHKHPVDVKNYIKYMYEAVKCHNKQATYNYFHLYFHSSPVTQFIKELFPYDVNKGVEYINIYKQKFGLTNEEKYDIGALLYENGKIDLAKQYLVEVYNIVMAAKKDENYPNRNSVVRLILKERNEGYFKKFNLDVFVKKEETCPHCNKKLIKIERKTFFGKRIICQNCKNEIDSK